MRLFSALTLLTALAAPLTSGLALPEPDYNNQHPQCLPPWVATNIVNAFVSLLTNFNVNVANSLLADNFQDFSDSINFLAGIPLGDVTFPSKQAFIGGQSQQPPLPSFQVLNIDAVTCNGVVVFRWLAQVGSEVDEVKGINVFYVVWTGQGGFHGWQIETNFSEFNSAAWDIDVGGTCTPPPPPPSGTSSRR